MGLLSDQQLSPAKRTGNVSRFLLGQGGGVCGWPPGCEIKNPRYWLVASLHPDDVLVSLLVGRCRLLRGGAIRPGGPFWKFDIRGLLPLCVGGYGCDTLPVAQVISALNRIHLTLKTGSVGRVDLTSLLDVCELS